MKFKAFGIEFSAHFLFVALISLVLITDNSYTVCVCFLSAVVHECGHLFAMMFCRIKPQRIMLRAFDIVIDADIHKSFLSDIFITLCGPLFNFVFSLVFMGVSQKFFYSNLVIGLFNLLPVKTFDGGHALYLLLTLFVSERCADIIINVITFVFLVPFLFFGILLLFNSVQNYSLLLIAMYLAAILFMK